MLVMVLSVENDGSGDDVNSGNDDDDLLDGNDGCIDGGNNYSDDNSGQIL